MTFIDFFKIMTFIDFDIFLKTSIGFCRVCKWSFRLKYYFSKKITKIVLISNYCPI